MVASHEELDWARREIDLRDDEDWRLETGRLEREQVNRLRAVRRGSIKASGQRAKLLLRAVRT